MKIKEENISLIINNIKDTLNLLYYQNEYNNKYDETLSNFFQISIIKNLFEELYKVSQKIDFNSISHISLDAKELLKIKELKLILLKMKLLVFTNI